MLNNSDKIDKIQPIITKKSVIHIDQTSGKKYLVRDDGKRFKLVVGSSIKNLNNNNKVVKLIQTDIDSNDCKLIDMKAIIKNNYKKDSQPDCSKITFQSLPGALQLRQNVITPTNLTPTTVLTIPKTIPNKTLVTFNKEHPPPLLLISNANVSSVIDQRNTQIKTNNQKVSTTKTITGQVYSNNDFNKIHKIAQTPPSWKCECSNNSNLINDHCNSDNVMLGQYDLKDKVKKQFLEAMKTALDFDQSGNAPIHTSVINNNYLMVKRNCLVLKAMQQSIDLFNVTNHTPLHLAIINNADINVLDILLENNSDLAITNTEGNSALHLAVNQNRYNLLKRLLERCRKIKFNLNIFNFDGQTPLIMAACLNNFDIVKLLLEFGADPNVKDMKSGKTALFYAAEEINVKIVKLLLDHNADPKTGNFFGTSPRDAMFELEMPTEIRSLILGKEQLRFYARRKEMQPQQQSQDPETTDNGNSSNNKRKMKRNVEPVQMKKQKIEVTSYLRPVDATSVLKVAKL